MQIRRAAERGHGAHGWLDSWHTFSFANYFDPRQMGFGPLRVINDDTVAPGMGFGEHGHQDMEILSYVLAGAVRHQDSAGHESVLGPGGVQRISAGSGIRHSEYNASDQEAVHFLQIWIQPETTKVEPAYGERAEPIRGDSGRWVIASPDGREESLAIHQQALVSVQRLAPGESAVWRPQLGHQLWLQVAQGALEVDGALLTAGDGASWRTLAEPVMSAGDVAAEVLLFELP